MRRQFEALSLTLAIVGCLGAHKVRYHKARDATDGGGKGDREGIYGFLGLLGDGGVGGGLIKMGKWN